MRQFRPYSNTEKLKMSVDPYLTVRDSTSDASKRNLKKMKKWMGFFQRVASLHLSNFVDLLIQISNFEAHGNDSTVDWVSVCCAAWCNRTKNWILILQIFRLQNWLSHLFIETGGFQFVVEDAELCIDAVWAHVRIRNFENDSFTTKNSARYCFGWVVLCINFGNIFEHCTKRVFILSTSQKRLTVNITPEPFMCCACYTRR